MSAWPRFTCSYRFEGSQWNVTFPARDFDEAERRLRAMGMNGQVDGQLIAEIPANVVTHFPLSVLLPVVVWVRNFCFNLFRRRP